MTGFVLTNQALSDLKAIGIYTQNTWGKLQRDRYLTALDKAFHALALVIYYCRDNVGHLCYLLWILEEL